MLAGGHHPHLDTQISRLGSANFHDLPINAALLSYARSGKRRLI
jgi:catalase